MKNGEQPEKNSGKELLDDLAEKNGLAIILADENFPAISKSNNNSMCEMLYNSEEFAPHCDKFCGKAFDWATEAGEPVHYNCYAGLSCVAIPMKREEKQTVAIVGRAFTNAENYRVATDRAIEGDWQQFPINEFFENLLLSNSTEHLEKLAGKVGKLSRPRVIEQGAEESFDDEVSPPFETEKTVVAATDNLPANGARKFKHWRSLFGSMLEMSYRQACFLTFQFIAERYSIENLAWLERRGELLEIIYAKGNLKDHEVKIAIAADDERLLEALKSEKPLELRERQQESDGDEPQTIWLFPIALGDEIHSAVVIGDESRDKEKQVGKFCRKIASDLEILRLRDRLERQSLLERAVGQFNESLKRIDSDDFWTNLMNISAELLSAERSSLLIFDEKSNAFVAKAATGIKSDFIKNKIDKLGERISRNVFNAGAAVVIENIKNLNLSAAPTDWLYKSDSFISYPIAIGERKIGVLNLTDRADGEPYSQFDLEILHSIMPQFAVLIDRANLINKAGEFEHLSVTDALTGLPNLRYLDEELAKEIKRSIRYKFPMSFLMIDVDDFKSYNDTFGHPEGDEALKLIGVCLKETLRAHDVAARYGGEEFSILLPQTTSEEAAVIAERVRERVENKEFPKRPVTVSIGVASLSLSLLNPDDLIAAADKALYAAKKAGRNNVQIYEKLRKD